MLNNHDKYSQVLEDRTLSGTPQCPSYLITKKMFFLQYIYPCTVCLYIYTVHGYIYCKKTFFFSNEAVGWALGVPDRVLSSSTCANITNFFS